MLLNLREAPPSPARLDEMVPMADPRLVVHPEVDHVFVEQYRRLGAALHQAQLRDGIRSLMVASAVEGEGKTLCATNLALTLSRSFRKRVLLVDGDLRKPSIHRLLSLHNAIGLRDVLQSSGQPLPAHSLPPMLSVITAGQDEPDPVALFASDVLRQFLFDTRDQFDWVLIDTPPVMLFPDAGLLAARLDACVFVVNAGTTKSSVAAKAVAAIGASRIVGVTLNRAELSEVTPGYGYGQYASAGRKNAGGTTVRWRSSER